MGRIRELAERSWAAEIEPYELWKPTGATEEIAPGVFFLHAFAQDDGVVFRRFHPGADFQAAGHRLPRKTVQLGDRTGQVVRLHGAALHARGERLGHHAEGLQVDDHVVAQRRREPAQDVVLASAREAALALRRGIQDNRRHGPGRGDDGIFDGQHWYV